MPGVSHFDRYSQRENQVTNNVLLVLRHLYQTAPGKLERVLRDLVGQEAIGIGLKFTQQTRGAASVPDGMIAQTPFRLYIETKLVPTFDLRQLNNHIESIAAARKANPALGEAFLLGLATETMDTGAKAKVMERALAQGVIFAQATFADLLDRLREVCAPHDVALAAVLDDFADYLDGQKLLDRGDDQMLVAACGNTFAENARFGVYYHEVDKPRRSSSAFFGAYRNWHVGLVGRIDAVLVCGYQDGKIQLINAERGVATPDALARIAGIIEATPYYDLKTTAHRYWVMDELAPMHLSWRGRVAVRGAQYLRLAPLLPSDTKIAELGARDLAQLLDGRSVLADPPPP
jgi:hypothetical protein